MHSAATIKREASRILRERQGVPVIIFFKKEHFKAIAEASCPVGFLPGVNYNPSRVCKTFETVHPGQCVGDVYEQFKMYGFLFLVV